MALRDRVFVVTGGAGYFGARLCLELLRRGAKEVRCFDLNATQIPPSLQQAAAVAAERGGSLSLVNGDVRSKEAVAAATSGADGVFHAASFGMSGKEMLQDAKIQAVNVDGTLEVLDACVRNSIPALVYTSTYNVVFGGQEIANGDESLPFFPLEKHVDSYASSKALAELFVIKSNNKELSSGKGKLRTCALRPAAIYGPGETRHFPRIMRHVRMGLLQFRIGSPSAKVDWVHVDNLVHAHCLAMAALLGDPKQQLAVGGEAFFVSDGCPMNNFDFLKPIVEAYGRRMPGWYVPVRLMVAVAWMIEAFFRIFCPLLWYSWTPQPLILPAEVYKVGVNHYFSIRKAQALLGYKPVVEPDEGVRQMQEHWRRVRDKQVPRPTAFETLLSVGGMILTAFSGFVPRPYLPWPLQQVQRLALWIFMSRDMIQMVFWGALAIHVAEACVAAHLATSWDPTNAAEWFVQTVLFGYPSLRLLLQRGSKKAFE